MFPTIHAHADSVEEGHKLVKTAIDAYGRIGRYCSELCVSLCAWSVMELSYLFHVTLLFFSVFGFPCRHCHQQRWVSGASGDVQCGLAVLCQLVFSVLQHSQRSVISKDQR